MCEQVYNGDHHSDSRAHSYTTRPIGMLRPELARKREAPTTHFLISYYSYRLMHVLTYHDCSNPPHRLTHAVTLARELHLSLLRSASLLELEPLYSCGNMKPATPCLVIADVLPHCTSSRPTNGPHAVMLERERTPSTQNVGGACVFSPRPLEWDSNSV